MPKRKPREKRNTLDRFMVLNAFVDYSLPDLSKHEITVWLVLYRDTRNGFARVSQKHIAERCGISDRTVRRMVKRLVEARLLVVVRRGGLAAGASTYRVIPVTKETYEARIQLCPVNEDT